MFVHIYIYIYIYIACGPSSARWPGLPRLSSLAWAEAALAIQNQQKLKQGHQHIGNTNENHEKQRSNQNGFAMKYRVALQNYCCNCCSRCLNDFKWGLHCFDCVSFFLLILGGQGSVGSVTWPGLRRPWPSKMKKKHKN